MAIPSSHGIIGELNDGFQGICYCGTHGNAVDDRLPHKAVRLNSPKLPPQSLTHTHKKLTYTICTIICTTYTIKTCKKYVLCTRASTYICNYCTYPCMTMCYIAFLPTTSHCTTSHQMLMQNTLQPFAFQGNSLTNKHLTLSCPPCIDANQ